MELGTFVHKELRPMGDINSNWRDIAMSQNGKNIIVISNKEFGEYGRIYISNDYGETWVRKIPYGETIEWENERCAASENYMVVDSYYGRWLFVSDDFGATWNSTYMGTGGIIYPSGNSENIDGYETIRTLDISGENFIVGMDGINRNPDFIVKPIYLSKDGARSWIGFDFLNIPTTYTQDGYGNAGIDGNNIVAFQHHSSMPYGGEWEIVRKWFISKNLGTSWEEITELSGIVPGVSKSIKIKGNKILILTRDGLLYSNDLGESWNLILESENLNVCGISDKFIVVVNNGIDILYSLDEGLTWKQTNPDPAGENYYWRNIAVLDKYLATIVENGRIYLSEIIMPELTTIKAEKRKELATIKLYGKIMEPEE